ncbi:hypothetical protein D5S18_22135 [Nocardia panacis]|uniref:Uncharacterized protein n=1 Tax=Nocardia panacis TaxID=2340916 RepID=A0A3A4KFT3_9NOCA|nr:hypothetical protein [Nocardia panacis]RJO72977.1 hypothetical protein D5S18_22135 [Nocardia panacis]
MTDESMNRDPLITDMRELAEVATECARAFTSTVEELRKAREDLHHMTIGCAHAHMRVAKIMRLVIDAEHAGCDSVPVKSIRAAVRD